MYTTDAPAACNISISSPAVVFTARHGHHHPHPSLTCIELSGLTSPGGASSVLAHCMWCSSKQPASHVPCHQCEPLVHVNRCTLVLDGPEWHLCYPKVHANRVRVICRHLCIKPRTLTRPKKFVLINWGSLLCESVLTKFDCSFFAIMSNFPTKKLIITFVLS